MKQDVTPFREDIHFGTREAPHNIEAEQALLGLIFRSNEHYDEISGFLEPHHFYDPLHGSIYREIEYKIEHGVDASPITVKPSFDNLDHIIEGMSVGQYLANLMTSGLAYGNPRDLAEGIISDYKMRSCIMIGEDLVNSGYARDHNTIEHAEADLYKLSQDRPDISEPALASVAAGELLADIRAGNKPDCVTSGLQDVDRMIGGYFKRELSIIAARPSMGKSAFVASTIRQIAKEGHGVGVLSFEMIKDQIMGRMLSDIVFNAINPIEYNRIRRHDLLPHETDRLEEASKRLEELPIYIDDQRGLSLPAIHAKARKIGRELSKSGHSLDVLFIDHMGLVRASDRYAGNKVHETGEISDALATLAKEMNIAVVALSQLNRGVEGRDNKVPTLADLRNSGDIEQDADMVAFLYRKEYYLERIKCETSEAEADRLTALEACRNKMTVSVAKQRSGATGNIELSAHMGSNAIRGAA